MSGGSQPSGISSWSIRNPVPTVVLFVVLTLAGLLGYSKLRTNSTPDIEIPTVTVTVTQRGAAPTEMETQVTRIVENAVSGLSNVDEVNSSVTQGSSTTSVEFALGTDVDRAVEDVRNAVTQVQSNLPDAADQPVIARVTFTGGAILTFVVDGPGKSPDDLSWFVDNDLAKAVMGTEGVAKTQRTGGVERAVRVKLDPARLGALGVSAADVSTALARTNVDEPGGRTKIGGQEQTVRTLGSNATVAGLAGTTVPVGSGPGVALSELGEVVDGWDDPSQRARLDGREVVGFNVYRSVGSSEVDVTAAVRKVVAAFDKGREDVTITEVTSSSDFVVESFHAAVEALWLGALLAVFVVLLFLRDLRATLVSAAALPLSLIPTFAVMGMFDLSLNNITLLALSLVVGILVDDAIVEIENIVRHMRQSGKSAYDAAIEAADEIGLAVVATTGTIIAVFLPVAFMPGIPGQFFKSFAIAICVSVAFSLVVARMLTPLMGAYLVKSGGHEEDTPRWVPAYLRALRGCMRFRWITMLAGVAFFVGSMWLASRLPTEFMTPSDRGRSVFTVETPRGSTLDDTDRAMQQVTKILMDQPESARVFASAGTPTEGRGPRGGAAGEVTSASVTVNLKPRSERDASQQEFEARVAPMLRAIPGVRVTGGGDGQSGTKASVTLVGDDQAKLEELTERLLVDMRAVDGFLNPTSTASASKPELLIKPDPARASEIGVTPSEIARAVSVATQGDVARSLAKFNLGDRQIPVLVTLDDDAVADPDEIALLPVKGTRATVPLGSVAEISHGTGPSSIRRVGMRNSATVEAQLDGLTQGQAAILVRGLPTMKALPDGISERQRGDQKRQAELFSGFAVAIASGIVLMYLTLVLLFRGFVQPVTILVALPLSLGGAMGMLWLTNYPIAITALIGVLMLMGIAAKNSILLVEYAIMAVQRGVTRREALLEAAEKRARPIVMTTVAMGAGMLPIALGIGADAESRAPMAIAVIGGLLSSTLLSLVYVPVVFTLLDDLEGFLGRHMGRLIAERPGAGAPDRGN